MTSDQLKDPIINHFIHNTDPRDYFLNIAETLRNVAEKNITQSQRIVRALKLIRPEISKEGFRKNVQKAIFTDAVAATCSDLEHAKNLIARAERRFGKIRARELFYERSEILQTWHTRDCKFVPDAYLIDKNNKTVICYEVEDSHPLNPFSIGEYAAAWWTLEYIYWDLHLIAYDVYGNPRLIAFPHSEFIAAELRKERSRNS